MATMADSVRNFAPQGLGVLACTTENLRDALQPDGFGPALRPENL